MRDRLRVVVTALMTCNAAFAQNRPSNSVLDPAFATIPFDRWLTEHDQAHFQWSAQISGGQLANSQRLSARVDVQVDGNELVKRRGIGELAFFVQFSDSDRRLFQSHGAIELQKVTDATGQSNVIFTQTALVVPGDYRVDLAILDTRTGEHATMQRTLRIASLKSDPLPDSWRGLPLVEFTEPADPPEAWFQPYLTGRLHLPLETRRPVRVEVLVNASPSAMDQRFRTSPVNNRNLADLLPGLKVISQVELHQGMLNVSMLDLTRRQVLFRQDHLNPQNHPLDWPRLRPALLQADPNKIDVRDLAHRQQNGQFFVEEVRRRLTAKEVLQADSLEKPDAREPELALIVLSGPMDFASGEDLRPIEFAQRPPGRVFYIRYHSVPIRPPIALPPPRPNRRRGIPPPQSGMVVQEPPDTLEPLLKPLQPRVFDVYNPEQFRKALANLMKDIALM